MLDTPSEVLTTMAGSFGYAAPEVMLKKGHGKPVDMWSLGVITYTLLCGYSPFRSENLQDLIEECRGGNVIFHDRYWKDVSKDAKEFIMSLLQPSPEKRATSGEALQHVWLSGKTATDHNLLPEIKAYMTKARLRRGIEIIKLANRIEALKMQEDDEGENVDEKDTPRDATAAANAAVGANRPHEEGTDDDPKPSGKKTLSAIARGAIFREVVLAKVREMKEEEKKNEILEEGKTKSGLQ